MSDAPFIHASAIVDAGAQLGARTKIWHFSHVMAGADLGADVVLGQNGFIAGSVRVGDRCRIQNNVSLYEGVELGEEVFIGPSVVFTNVRNPRAAVARRDQFEVTRVARGVTIGANATIRCGVELGAYAFVGAGAVVTRDVAPHAMVAGVPARRVGWACRCGERISSDPGLPVAPLPCATCATLHLSHGDGLSAAPDPASESHS